MQICGYTKHDKKLYARVIIPLKGSLNLWKIFYFGLCAQSTCSSGCLGINHSSLYNPTSVCIFTLFYTFPKVPTRRICLTLRVSLVGDPFLYSPVFNFWFRGNVLRRNEMLVTHRIDALCSPNRSKDGPL